LKSHQALWQALILADAEGIKRHSEGMNAGEAYPLFAAMLTTRPWDQITRRSVDHLHIPGTNKVKTLASITAMADRSLLFVSIV
jgi:aarF domain-containing kinase